MAFYRIFWLAFLLILFMIAPILTFNIIKKHTKIKQSAAQFEPYIFSESNIPNEPLRTALNKILAIVKMRYTADLRDVSLIIKKHLVERLAIQVPRTKYNEIVNKLSSFKNLIDGLSSAISEKDEKAAIKLIKSCIGSEDNQNAVLFKQYKHYIESLRAGTIINTLEDDEQILF